MKKPKNYVWVIAYIDFSLVHKIPSDLRKSNQYKGIKPIIPTVRVLKKQLKKKDHFKEVPLLMNYGFFRIPINWALNIDLLNKIKADISCISGWVRDKAKGNRVRHEEDKGPYEVDERDVPIACTTKKKILQCCKIADALSIFNSDDIKKVEPGAIIHLMGYPFDGMMAKVLEINTKSKKLKVALANLMDEDYESYDMVVEVHFDNVFYSVYQGSHDENYNKQDLLEDFHLNRRKQTQDEI